MFDGQSMMKATALRSAFYRTAYRAGINALRCRRNYLATRACALTAPRAACSAASRLALQRAACRDAAALASSSSALRAAVAAR